MASKRKDSDLFTSRLGEELERVRGLAEKLRPVALEEFAGQDHILGEGRPLRRIHDEAVLTSLVFWGPPGTGKTTFARIMAKRTGAFFEEYSAVTSKLEDIRRVVRDAEHRITTSEQRTIIFVDEFHRFNKAQQDAFLPHLESGLLTLVGATTENPFFVLNPALRSRISIFHFDRLDDGAMNALIDRALESGELRAEGGIDESARDELMLFSNGDGRVLLNLLDLASRLAGEGGRLTAELVRETASQRNLDYGRLGTDRFDMVSAFIKSMRGSNPDAALYWMLRLLEGGEQPEFIARRMVIFAAEDIGCAAPQAITVATSTVDAVSFVGMPEARIPLSSCCVFLATCTKSNAAYRAMHKALEDVQKRKHGPVPLHLRNYDFTKEKTGEDAYKYPHDYPGNFVEQEYFPPGMAGTVYYSPSEQGHEGRIKKRLEHWRGRNINKDEIDK